MVRYRGECVQRFRRIAVRKTASPNVYELGGVRIRALVSSAASMAAVKYFIGISVGPSS